MKLSLLGFAFIGAASAQSFPEWTVGQTVQTTSGPVQGHAATNATAVSEYLGIPFAIPPIGNLRWTAPQKYTSNSTINGTSFGYSCPGVIDTATGSIASANLTTAGALILSEFGQIGDKFSEDCLTVNVWTKPQVGEAKKAVLVWIYGGGFTYGNTDNPAYSGKFIADQEDVVLVSLNYRLNIFGFPGFPNVTQNLGLLDQRLAIEWVRDNIPAFGGDPSRITIFGQSAGGASVDYYSYAWTQDPIVNGLISESGTVFGIPPKTASASASEFSNTTSYLGCGNSSSVLSCMRSKSESDLISAQEYGFGSFGPTIDEIIVFSDLDARSKAGNFIKKPLLIGNTDYEGGLFATIEAIAGATPQPHSFWESFSNETFVCPAAARANVSISNNVPTWRYRWFGNFPNTMLTTYPDSGAYHISELPLIFDTLPTGAGVPASTQAEVAIGNYIRGAWAAFAKDPVSGLSNYGGGWPTYEVQGDTLIRLAYQNQTGSNLAPGNAYDGSCSTIYAINGTIGGGVNGTGSTGTGSSSGAGKKTIGYLLGLVAIGLMVLM